jgi:hypothetical protein
MVTYCKTLPACLKKVRRIILTCACNRKALQGRGKPIESVPAKLTRCGEYLKAVMPRHVAAFATWRDGWDHWPRPQQVFA